MFTNFDNFNSRITEHSTVFYPELRAGNTGCGYTFENFVLKKYEDNKREADFDGIEAKTTLKASAPIRLNTSGLSYTKKELLNYYGAYHPAKERVQWYPSVMKVGKITNIGNNFSTLGGTLTMTECGIQAHIVERSTNEVVRTIGEWKNEEFEEYIDNKLVNLALVRAEKSTKEGMNFYRYNSATYFADLNIDHVRDAFQRNLIGLEIRMQEKHDHGSAFTTSTARAKKIYPRWRNVKWINGEMTVIKEGTNPSP